MSLKIEAWIESDRAFRVCHVCGALCEHVTEVRRCGGCGKQFAPFFYFDDRHQTALSASDLRPEPSVGRETRAPIFGLTAHWSAPE